jgi:hypothetical protein
MTQLEPLDDDVLALLDAAKNIEDLAPSAKARILVRVASAAFVAPLASTDAPAATPPAPPLSDTVRAVRLGAALLATFGLGVATGRSVAPARSVSEVPAAPAPRVEAAPSERDTSAVAVDSLPTAKLPPPTRVERVEARAEAHESATVSAHGLGVERSLLDVARAALARGEPTEALLAVARHERAYKDGALVEEREALAIKALVALGRTDEARARAQLFSRRFPNGLLLHAVKGAVGDF